MNIEEFLPTKEDKRSGIKMKARYITIHETDNENKGSSAFFYARLGNKNQVMPWHYIVDDSDIIYQVNHLDEVAFQIDDLRSTCNMNSVGISLCVNKGSVFRRTRYNAIQLVIFLKKKLNIPLGNVYPRHKWDKSGNPKKILSMGWHHFIGELKYELDKSRR